MKARGSSHDPAPARRFRTERRLLHGHNLRGAGPRPRRRQGDRWRGRYDSRGRNLGRGAVPASLPFWPTLWGGAVMSDAHSPRRSLQGRLQGERGGVLPPGRLGPKGAAARATTAARSRAPRRRGMSCRPRDRDADRDGRSARRRQARTHRERYERRAAVELLTPLLGSQRLGGGAAGVIAGAFMADLDGSRWTCARAMGARGVGKKYVT